MQFTACDVSYKTGANYDKNVAMEDFLPLNVSWRDVSHSIDDRALLTEENERRWNTPPELIPEQLIKTSDVKSGRSLSIPITTNINVNAGNNAHSLGFQLVPEGVSYSESNSFDHPLSEASGYVLVISRISGIVFRIKQRFN